MIFKRKSKMTPAIEERIRENNDMLDAARAAVASAKDRAAEMNGALHDFLGIPIQSDHQTMEETAYSCRAAGGERAVALEDVMGEYVAAAEGLRIAMGDYAAAGVEFEAASQSLFKDLGLKPPVI